MKLDHVGWNFGILTPHFRTKCWALKVKQVISKYLENQKEKGIVQIAYFLKNMHRTYVVQYHIATNQEQISEFWGSPILSSLLSTRKWLKPMIQSRLSFIARSYLQDLIYICHTQQGSFDHTYKKKELFKLLTSKKICIEPTWYSSILQPIRNKLVNFEAAQFWAAYWAQGNDSSRWYRAGCPL